MTSPDLPRDAPEPTGDEGDDIDMEMPKVYEPIESFDALRERLVMFLAQYNEMVRGVGMDLVFFMDAMVHLIKVRGMRGLLGWRKLCFVLYRMGLCVYCDYRLLCILTCKIGLNLDLMLIRFLS